MTTPILRQIDIPNSLTLTGLMLSLFSVIFAIQQNFYAALICLIYSGIVDMFDGVVARKIQRTELQAEVGKNLDSLVDICSFGFAPAIFAYCYGLRDALSIAVLMVYVAANVLRLAYFNSTGLASEGNNEYFTGLPVTYAALFIPLSFLVSFFVPVATMKLVLAGMYLILAIAMVANFQMKKLKGIWYGIFSLGALSMTIVYAWAIIGIK